MSAELEKKQNDITIEIAKFLSKRDEHGNTILHYVVQTDNEVFARQLVAAGCDLNVKNNEGDPALAIAIRVNQFKMVKVLLKAGANRRSDHFKDKEGPLLIAARHGCPGIVQLLIEFGVDVNIRTETLQTPLHLACGCMNKNMSCAYFRIINKLIDAGADINAIDNDNKTLLLVAVERGFYAGFELLLNMGADIRIKGELDFRFLNEAVENCDFDILKRLLKLGYDVNMTDEGYSCLHAAVSSSNIEMTEFLFHSGAVITVDNEGFDPLCFALQYWWECYLIYEDETNYDHDQEIEESTDQLYIKHVKLLDLMIKNGTNVNHVTNDGQTPLYIILQSYDCLHSDYLRILLKNGAKFDFDHPLVREVINNTNGSKFPHLLLRHTAMFEAQGRSDGPSNFDLNNLDEELRKDYARCRDELEFMKSTKIDDTNVSFFNVLVDRNIGPYTRNESIRNVFETANVSKSFPIYKDLLCERFSEEVTFQELVNEATHSLGHLLNWSINSTHLLLSNILRYLNKKDLTNLKLV